MTDLGTSVYASLQRMARKQRRGAQQAMELYVHERLLARVAASTYADRLTLKGGMLLAALNIRGVTRDVDLLARALNNDPAQVEAVVAEIATIDLRDGLKFDVSHITSMFTREDADYQGLRVRMPVQLSSARLVAQLDINFGDPIEGVPTQVGGMFASSIPRATSFVLNAYRVEDLLAEKIATMTLRGDLNTRERDYGDVWLISRRIEIDADQLMFALIATAQHRQHELTPLSERLVTIAVDRQGAWERYCDVVGDQSLPNSYTEVVGGVIAFADPVIGGKVAGLAWAPATLSWT